MKNQVVHVQTTVQSIFGILDECGNIVNKQPVNFEVSRLDQASFSEALAKLLEVRKTLNDKAKGVVDLAFANE